jgi:outer membrane protein, heavy metal efflux system
MNYPDVAMVPHIVCVLALVGLSAGSARADEPLPEPLRLADAIARAKQHRAEILAMRARARAAASRPAIVSALDDPMVLSSIDHVPFAGGGLDWSVRVQQSFPLSGIRGHRERAARAAAAGIAADADRVTLDVELEASNAFLMLREQRQMAAILVEQKALADQFVTAATARYGAGKGSQAEVRRAEIEVARLAGEIKAKAAEVSAAVAMLDTSIGRSPDLPIGELAEPSIDEPVAQQATVDTALERRPELRAGRAEIERARAEVEVMDDMYKPMAMVQTGPSYTMIDGHGWMVMVGVSVPLWRGKLRAGVDEAKAMTEMAEQDLVAMQRMVAGEAVVARQAVIAARARWIALRDEVVPRARAAIEPTLTEYGTGQLPLVSVLEAAQALWMAQIDLASAERQFGLARARLARATAKGEPR